MPGRVRAPGGKGAYVVSLGAVGSASGSCATVSEVNSARESVCPFFFWFLPMANGSEAGREAASTWTAPSDGGVHLP